MKNNKKTYTIKEIFLESVQDHTGKISSARLSSFFILAGIMLSSVIFTLIEVGNYVSSFRNDAVYEIPYSHIALFTAVLGHHLVLLGLKGKTDIQFNKNTRVTTDSMTETTSNNNNIENQGSVSGEEQSI